MATAPLKDKVVRTIWHTVQIKSLEQTRAEHAPIITRKPIDSPKIWLVEANQRGRAILSRIQADIRERKAVIPKPNNKSFSGQFNHRTKIITKSEVIQNVKAEAKTAYKSSVEFKGGGWTRKEHVNF